MPLKIPFLFGLLFSILMVSCNPEDQMETDQELIEAYLEDNNLVSQSTPSGLHYIIENPGNNEHPGPGDVIQISYTGRLLNGQIFDASPYSSFPLNNLIEGWQEGIPLFGKGGSGILIIPSHLGYGDEALPGLPANSVLVFNITLIDF